MSESAAGHVADIELRSSWEGPAEHAPGVLFGVSNGEGMLAGDVALADLAGWVALAALSGVIGNSVYEAIKTKVQVALVAWRRCHGQTQLDDLKQEVCAVMRKHRPNGKLTEDELNHRIDAFFNEIQGVTCSFGGEKRGHSIFSLFVIQNMNVSFSKCLGARSFGAAIRYGTICQEEEHH